MLPYLNMIKARDPGSKLNGLLVNMTKNEIAKLLDEMEVIVIQGITN